MISVANETVSHNAWTHSNTNNSRTKDVKVNTTFSQDLLGDSEEDYYDPMWFLADHGYQIFTGVVAAILPFLVASFGTVSNTINIVVFYRQGPLKDSCTASLVCLSLSDLIVCLVKCMTCATILPYALIKQIGRREINQAVINANAFGVIFNAHVMFCTSISSWITAYIALERMVSVVLPFQVKMIFTARRTYAAIVFMFVISFILQSPKTLYYKIVFHDTSNSSAPVNHNLYQESGLIGSAFADLCVFVNDFVLRVVCVIFIVLFNSVLIVKVNLSSRFRKSISSINSSKAAIKAASSPSNPDSRTDERIEGEQKLPHSSKAKKEVVLTKMIIVLCVMFIVCFFPVMIVFISLGIKTGLPAAIQFGFDVFGILTETVNSSFNIFIYYTMSSRFNKELRQLLSCGRSK